MDTDDALEELSAYSAQVSFDAAFSIFAAGAECLLACIESGMRKTDTYPESGAVDYSSSPWGSLLDEGGGELRKTVLALKSGRLSLGGIPSSLSEKGNEFERSFSFLESEAKEAAGKKRSSWDARSWGAVAKKKAFWQYLSQSVSLTLKRLGVQSLQLEVATETEPESKKRLQQMRDLEKRRVEIEEDEGNAQRRLAISGVLMQRVFSGQYFSGEGERRPLQPEDMIELADGKKRRLLAALFDAMHWRSEYGMKSVAANGVAERQSGGNRNGSEEKAEGEEARSAKEMFAFLEETHVEGGLAMRFDEISELHLSIFFVAMSEVARVCEPIVYWKRHGSEKGGAKEAYLEGEAWPPSFEERAVEYGEDIGAFVAFERHDLQAKERLKKHPAYEGVLALSEVENIKTGEAEGLSLEERVARLAAVTNRTEVEYTKTAAVGSVLGYVKGYCQYYCDESLFVRAMVDSLWKSAEEGVAGGDLLEPAARTLGLSEIVMQLFWHGEIEEIGKRLSARYK